LSSKSENTTITDERMSKLFIFSLKDMIKYLLCFEDIEETQYYEVISSSLTSDLNSFSREQIYKLPDYKILIDWVTRFISRLLYISKLLAFALLGPKKISKYQIKTAKGISGPWARLDLPMEERVFDFGDEIDQRTKGKQKQERYRQGLENYNNDGRVGEGYMWREMRNEPFKWTDRSTEDPYPGRNLLRRVAKKINK
jgi:hypothetical protein